LGVAQNRLDLCAVERLDAARGVDLIDRHGRADATLLTRIGQGASDRMQEPKLHPGALCA